VTEKPSPTPREPEPPADGETVRVLEPYVTPGQAAGLVRDQLGGAPLDTGADAGGAPLDTGADAGGA